MKRIAKLFAVAALAIGLTAHAEDARKTAVLDTGKGGVKVVMSVPNWADGPYDFGKNPGVSVKTVANLVYGEGMFNAGLGDTGVVVYQAMVARRLSAKAGDQPVTAEHLANEMLETKGFTMARAVKIDSPDAGIDGAKVVAYKASGMSILDGKERTKDRMAMVVMALSMPDQTRGFTIMATVFENNVAKFDADPAKYEKRAMNGFGDLFKNSEWKVNP